MQAAFAWEKAFGSEDELGWWTEHALYGEPCSIAVCPNGGEEPSSRPPTITTQQAAHNLSPRPTRERRSIRQHSHAQ
jgi:hypothetical protein